MSVNKAILVGRLGQDPESKEVKGTQLCHLNVATDDKYKDKDGNWKNAVEWHRVAVFGKRVESIMKYLSKGSMVFVEGKIQTNKYKDKDGNDRYGTNILASEIRFLPSGGKGSGGGSAKKQSEPERPGDEQDDDLPF